MGGDAGEGTVTDRYEVFEIGCHRVLGSLVKGSNRGVEGRS